MEEALKSNANPAVEAILAWWFELQRETGPSRAARARLRRCPTVFDALLLEETHDLISRARRAGYDPFDQRLALLAMALARVKAGGPGPRFTKVLGYTAKGQSPTRDKGDRPRLSPLRFGTLMRAARRAKVKDEWDDFGRALRRAFAVLRDVPFDVRAFVGDVLFLRDEILQRWTYAYWQPDALAEEAAGSQSSDTDGKEPSQ